MVFTYFRKEDLCTLMNFFFFSYHKIDVKPDDRLLYADFLTVVHEYWIPAEDDNQQLQEAFDTLDPDNKSKLIVDDFVHLLRNCGWPEEEIELILSQVNCADGYFIIDGNAYCLKIRMLYKVIFFVDLQKLLKTSVELPKKKSAKSKKKAK